MSVTLREIAGKTPRVGWAVYSARVRELVDEGVRVDEDVKLGVVENVGLDVALVVCKAVCESDGLSVAVEDDVGVTVGDELLVLVCVELDVIVDVIDVIGYVGLGDAPVVAVLDADADGRVCKT